jgi:hypothetical protein
VFKFVPALFLVPAAILAALVIACGDDDDDDDNVLNPPTQEETATPAPTQPPTDGTAQPTQPPGGTETPVPGDPGFESPTPLPPSEGDCAGDLRSVLPEILARLDASDQEGVWNCLSSDFQSQLGPDFESFVNGEYSALAEGLGSFPADSEVIFAELTTETVGLSAIRSDRTVEGMNERAAVYAGLGVLERGSWRLGVPDLFVEPVDPTAACDGGGGNVVPCEVTAGRDTLEFSITGITDWAEGPGDLRVWVDGDIQGGAGDCSDPSNAGCVIVEPDFDNGAFDVSVGIAPTAGDHFVIVYLFHEGEYAVGGWSFTAA